MTDAPVVPLTLDGIVSGLKSDLMGVFERMEIAEDEIAKAQAEHPQAWDLLWHSFSLLQPTHDLMETRFVFEGHVRELLARVVAGQDTRPGTAAEVCIACCQASLVTPLNTPAAGLYARMWGRAFPGHPVWADQVGHYEAIEGQTIDTFEAETRARIGRANPWRVLGEVECKGLHHGEPALGCRFVVQDSHLF